MPGRCWRPADMLRKQISEMRTGKRSAAQATHSTDGALPDARQAIGHNDRRRLTEKKPRSWPNRDSASRPVVWRNAAKPEQFRSLVEHDQWSRKSQPAAITFCCTAHS